MEDGKFNGKFNKYEMWKSLRDKYEGEPEYADAWKLVDIALNGKPPQTTIGEYKSEKEAAADFDSAINPDFFFNEAEVKGRRLFDDKPIRRDIRQERKEDDSAQKIRIDRILYPGKKAIDAGWTWGPIAVEIKKSNIPIGPIFSQVLEYRQSIFLSKTLHYTRIMPMVFAIFPSRDISHDLHSLQENQTILSCYLKYGATLRFGTFGTNALEISPSGMLVGGSFKPNSTKGHRGREK